MIYYVSCKLPYPEPKLDSKNIPKIYESPNINMQLRKEYLTLIVYLILYLAANDHMSYDY